MLERTASPVMPHVRALALLALGIVLALLHAASVRAQNLAALPNGVFVAGGQIAAVAVQGDGKIVVGGTFVAINGVQRHNIARLNADGSVDPVFNPGADDHVFALAVTGSLVYVAGGFQHIGAQARAGLAALDIVTGTPAAWTPNPSGYAGSTSTQRVLAVSPDGSTVFVSGDFVEIGGAARDGFAAVRASDGTALAAWNQAFNGTARAFAIAGNTLYVGGGFTTIDSQGRAYLAAFNIASGALLAWNPGADGYVSGLAVNGSRLYVAGQFFRVGAQTHQNLAAVDTASGAALVWSPQTDFQVLTIAATNSAVYFGGPFENVNGQPQAFVAAVNTTTGASLPWHPTLDNEVISLAPSNAGVVLGGAFLSANGAPSGGLALVDPNSAQAGSGQLSGGEGSVAAFAQQPDGKLIVGGSFTAVGAVPRNNLARLNPDGSLDAGWDPGADGAVSALALNGNLLYVGGSFQNIGGHFRFGLAALDVNTAVATPWQPNPDGNVYALAMCGNTVFAGGGFSHIGNAYRPMLAQLDDVDGLATDWNASPDNGVHALYLAGNTLYAGGAFQSVGGVPRYHLAAFDATTAQLAAWNPGASGNVVMALAPAGNRLIVGGDFQTLGGATRYGVGAVDLASGSVDAWDPSLDSFGASVAAIAVSGSTVFVGGQFSTMSGASRTNLAALDIASAQPQNWDAPVARTVALFYPPHVSALAVTPGGLFAGGQFDTALGAPRASLARVSMPDEIFHDGFD